MDSEGFGPRFFRSPVFWWISKLLDKPELTLLRTASFFNLLIFPIAHPISSQKKSPIHFWMRDFYRKEFGGDLLSHPVAQAVPSALKSLTAVFGMGTGVTSSLLPPKIYISRFDNCRHTRLPTKYIKTYDNWTVLGKKVWIQQLWVKDLNQKNMVKPHG